MSVKWYSGYKSEEKPVSFTLDNEEQLINKVIGEELVENSSTGDRKRIFIVETSKGIYKIVHDGDDRIIKIQ
ncbi:MAG: hypothetical protein QMD71_09425 [bacterium]|nr:hypothetical protein [bacterium]